MYTPPNQQAMDDEKSDVKGLIDACAEDPECLSFLEAGRQWIAAVYYGPYQSDSLNKKLRDAKLFLERYGNRPLTKWGLYSRPGQR